MGWGAGLAGLLVTALVGCGDIEPPPPPPPPALSSGAGGAPAIFVRTTTSTPDAGAPAATAPDAAVPPTATTPDAGHPSTGCGATSGKGPSSGCTGGAVCNPATGTCVECLTNADCKSGKNGRCDVATFTCSACSGDGCDGDNSGD